MKGDALVLTMVAETSMVEEIRRTAEHRLREIEPLIAEADQLRDVLSAIDRHPTPAAVRAPTANTEAAHGNGNANGSNTNGNGNGSRHNGHARARKGANKQVILELIAQHPGITTAEIARATDIKRTVVASTVSRLKRHGELEPHEHGVRVAAR
jgi:hypothetical protein